jgi:hypothetical protein
MCGADHLASIIRVRIARLRLAWPWSANQPTSIATAWIQIYAFGTALHRFVVASTGYGSHGNGEEPGQSLQVQTG